MKIRNPTMTLLSIALTLICFVSPVANSQEVSESRAYDQPNVPEGWTETPFVETAPVPELTELETQRGFLLFQRPITEPVYPNTRPLPHERLDSLNVFATPGELEPATLSLYPVRDLKNLTVRCSDLASDAGQIAASNIDVRLLTYWNVRYPRYTSDGTYRRVPELLERVVAHSSRKNECQRWWLTVRVPDDAAAGLYRGGVTIQDDSMQQPVRVPLVLRVLDFRLQRDPRKHLSTYYYPRNRTMFEGHDDAFIDRATANEYRSMVEHGLDMLPTFSLQLDRDSGKIVVREAAEIERMLTAGLKGPLSILGDNVIARVYHDTTPDGKRESHWNITQNPPPEFYARVTELFSDLKKDCLQQGWPDLICCPLDEVAAASKEFGAKVYQAVKAAGVRTYATKNPSAVDAVAYDPFVDVWCSQPFARPYQQVIADRRHEYWSYPNHNACEIKNRRVMCKGGRMTYGFGFWRSGYTTLIPWHWAWTFPPSPMDYLRTRRSGCGMRIDAAGNVIPAVYWECFREGYDDARYLFTLQQTAWQREGSPDAECRRLVESAKRELQQIWDSIDVQERYLQDDLWPSSEFNARRWQMALLTQRLLRYPAVREGVAPSVYVARTDPRTDEAPSIIQSAEANGKLKSLDLADGFAEWTGETLETSIDVVPVSADSKMQMLRWNVGIDHDAGGTADGTYNVGWPRVRRVFDRNEVDMTRHDFLEIALQVDSDRDEVQDDVTMLGVSFSTHDVPRLHELKRDLGDRQRETIRLYLSVPELIRSCDKGTTPWKSLAYLQLVVAEANYAHGTSLQFDVRNVRLLGFNQPVISKLDAPRVILLPRKSLSIPFELMGANSIGGQTYRLRATLIDAEGKPRASNIVPAQQSGLLVLDTTSLSPGSYELKTEVLAGDRPISENTVIVQAVGN